MVLVPSVVGPDAKVRFMFLANELIFDRRTVVVKDWFMVRFGVHNLDRIPVKVSVSWVVLKAESIRVSVAMVDSTRRLVRRNSKLRLGVAVDVTV